MADGALFSSRVADVSSLPWAEIMDETKMGRSRPLFKKYCDNLFKPDLLSKRQHNIPSLNPGHPPRKTSIHDEKSRSTSNNICFLIFNNSTNSSLSFNSPSYTFFSLSLLFAESLFLSLLISPLTPSSTTSDPALAVDEPGSDLLFLTPLPPREPPEDGGGGGTKVTRSGRLKIWS
eukprot:CAMPEP_0184729534 /NCGR_PEP_ID=MMETSP0314-20130426/44454_1 /TAXON_ID=38298 /ORGANISM="Rhodella maculata, Strain CCMP 736" /LENGTH=175 /DNA_ID=CAMNT_0027195577 /DNA_START=50 /DNA_END=574 /DNA_ORIENTATION=-